MQFGIREPQRHDSLQCLWHTRESTFHRAVEITIIKPSDLVSRSGGPANSSNFRSFFIMAVLNIESTSMLQYFNACWLLSFSPHDIIPRPVRWCVHDQRVHKACNIQKVGTAVYKRSTPLNDYSVNLVFVKHLDRFLEDNMKNWRPQIWRNSWSPPEPRKVSGWENLTLKARLSIYRRMEVDDAGGNTEKKDIS